MADIGTTFDPNATPGYGSSAWTNLITGQSSYLGWKLGAAAQADQAKSARQAAMRALAVNYGGLPSGFKDAYGDLSARDLQTARDNPLSQTANAQKQYGDSITSLQRSLAARGALQSGDLGYGLGQLDRQHASDIYGLGNQFTDAAQKAIGDYGSTLTGLNEQEIQQLRDAASQVYQEGYRLGPDGSISYTDPLTGITGPYGGPSGGPSGPPSNYTPPGGTGPLVTIAPGQTSPDGTPQYGSAPVGSSFVVGGYTGTVNADGTITWTKSAAPPPAAPPPTTYPTVAPMPQAQTTYPIGGTGGLRGE